MGKIGIFGGSFSPFHCGHGAVARGVIEHGLADEVWLMPCRRNPLKDGSTLLADDIRLSILREAAEEINGGYGEEKIKVCTLELEMPLPSYTCNTLIRLKEEYPDKDFRIVVGGDSYLDFTRWKEWEWIERNFSPIVYPRPGYEIKNLRPSWTLLEGEEQIDISSTQLRATGIWQLKNTNLRK